MFSISKEFAISASHQLEGLPNDHPCTRLHGHNYLIRVTLSADYLDRVGFILDYGDLDPFARWLSMHVDHRHINDVIPHLNPTAEHLAAYLHKEFCSSVRLPEDVRVLMAVSETPKTWASYTL